MVYGNMGDDCATGVAFTRDPSTGENYFYGEYLVNAQGEDVVAGIRTPQPINKAKHKPGDLPAMEDVLPVITSYSIHYTKLYDYKAFKIARLRLPWLITNLFGGVVTGYLMWLFKVTLKEVIALISFILRHKVNQLRI